MSYLAERKVNATFYTDRNKTEVRTLTQTFKSCKDTIEECKESLTKQINKYADNPYMISVTNISEYFKEI